MKEVFDFFYELVTGFFRAVDKTAEGIKDFWKEGTSAVKDSEPESDD